MILNKYKKMSNSNFKYISFITKDSFNNINFPKTPFIKNHFITNNKATNKNHRSHRSLKSKDKRSNSNSNKKCKIKSNLISRKNSIKKDKANKNIIQNNININNICKNVFMNNNTTSINFNYLNNNIKSNNFYNKKIKQIIDNESNSKSKSKSNSRSITKNNSKRNTDSIKANSLLIKTYSQSLAQNNSVTNKKKNNYSNGKVENKNYTDKNNFIYYTNQKKPSLLFGNLSNKNYEKKIKSRGKPMSLLEKNSKKNNKKNEKSDKSGAITNYKVLLINNTNINYRNFFSDLMSSNDFLQSHKNETTPISMKQHKPKIKNKTTMPNTDKEIKKSQSQFHLNCNISKDLNNKEFSKKANCNNKNKSNKKINKKEKKSKESFKNLGEHKNMIRNKTTNFNLNINNFNNINKNLILYPSNKKSPLINIKYSDEKNKSHLSHKDKNYYQNINDYQKNNIYEECNKEPLFNEIQNLWNSIGGVTQEYQEIFINYMKKNENKKVIFSNEIAELTLILNNLDILNKDIQLRNEIISKIKNIKNNNIINNIEEIKNLLISLREKSIEIINDYILFLKDISYDVLINKFDINKIKNFDKNYINKMKNDCDFLLEDSHLNKIFHFGKNDPFLISLSSSKLNIIKEKNKYLSLPINNDIFQNINKCQYFLLKEKICGHIAPFNIINFTNNNHNVNIIKNNLINSLNTSNNNKNNINYSNDEKSLFINDTADGEKKDRKINEKQSNLNETNNNKSMDNNSKIMKKSDSDCFVNIYSNEYNKSPMESKHKNNTNLISDDNLTIYPYISNKDKDLSSLYNKYLSSVDDNIKQSFNINYDIFHYSNIGIYPKLLLFKDNNKRIQGICTMSYNQNISTTLALNKKILTITSISCSKKYKISKILLSLEEFCQKQGIDFESMEINLYYMKKDGKFILDKSLEKEIKTEANFKWVRLDNDGEKRKIKYHFLPSKPKMENDKNNSLNESNYNKYAIFLDNYALLKFDNNDLDNNISINEYSKIFFIINILKKYYLLNNNNDKEIETILANLRGIKLKKIIRILSEYCNVLETNINDFSNDYYNNFHNEELLNSLLEEIKKNKDKNNPDMPLSFNFFRIYTNFSNITKVEIDEYEYNIISMNDYLIEAFSINNNKSIEDNFDINTYNIYDNNNNFHKNEIENDLIYFTKSEIDNISFIFYEIKDDININDRDNENYIKLLFSKVLNKIIIKDNEEPVKSYKKICIPSFIYKKRNSEKENKNEKGNDKLQLIEHEILDYSESLYFCVENMEQNDIKFTFPIVEDINCTNDLKVIKNNFIVAMINSDLVLDYHLPSMSIFYIDKDNWIKAKK